MTSDMKNVWELIRLEECSFVLVNVSGVRDG